MGTLTEAPPRQQNSARQGSRGGPRSLRARVLLTAFVTIHVPLIVTVAYLLFAPDRVGRELVLGVVIAATVVGAALVIWLLDRLLRPLAVASRTLSEYASRVQALDSRERGNDEVRSLLAQLSQVLGSAERRTNPLEAQAHRDPLTGLLDRRAAERQLTHSLALLERSSIPLCVAIIDVDRFKEINDTLGHLHGDRVLSAVAATVRRHARRKSDWAARWGGDELLLALYTDLPTANAILHRLRRSIAEDALAGEHAPVTVSIGVTSCLPGEDLEGCLARADDALHRARQAGRDRVEVGE